ncbi:BIRC6 [Mytilus coruscus]|uniref:BIRC6 n=1 Tax=Mytilus coruscus TaxID=42192 RepID=A0A6J8EH44_MYTCO|nr:BIRC6 [Mytilus coruscus]
MAAGSESSVTDVLIGEFEEWQASESSEAIFLLETSTDENNDIVMLMLLASEHEFKLHIPKGYPDYNGTFSVEADPAVKLWSTALNESLVDLKDKIKLSDFLKKAVVLHTNKNKRSEQRHMSSDDDIMEEDEESEEEEEEEEECMMADDDAFTTEWDLKVARKKKRWAQKEAEIRDQMKKAKLSQGAGSMEKKPAENIFTSNAAAGILTNDLVRIMEEEQELSFTAEPIEDNIYNWRVKIFHFDAECGLAEDLLQIQSKFGYNYIELEMTFEIDLYPFYPPLVKVMRPRLQCSMMQRVTNMEMLKLSYWIPTKDMKSVIQDIKTFLQQWARLEVNSPRNDLLKYPYGAYVEIEHHLLTLALVSEVNPRVNYLYDMDISQLTEQRTNKPNTPPDKSGGPAGKNKPEYWAKGTGYGHHYRSEWDINAYIAAQKEKDNKVETVLHKILEELKLLYTNHAPQLKPRTLGSQPEPDTGQTGVIDPVEDMFTVLDGSALIPFIEQYLTADSFLEICRHSVVYRVIIDIIKEIARQKQLLPLLVSLPNQQLSVYKLLEQLEKKASMMLKHLCKAGNGSIPTSHQSWDDPPETSAFGLIPKCFGRCRESSSHSSSSDSDGEEEKIAREMVSLFNNVKDTLERNNLLGNRNNSSDNDQTIYGEQIPPYDVLNTKCDAELEVQYKQVLKSMQFGSSDLPLEGNIGHHYANLYKSHQAGGQKQIFRIAQELTSLSSSLPLNLSSSIFVRTDDEKITLMRALITGPEGTPYSGGCFLFDIYFPPAYPRCPPQVNLHTTGSGKVRFNPNLYACGKVCLSLLGTWEGQKGEQWNEKTSTVLQILVSIQSLILVPDPYFNEPGFEQEIGTETGQKHSDEYNEDVCYNNIKYAMIGNLQNPPPEFSEVIKAHFYMKKDKMIKEVQGWVDKHDNRRLTRMFQNLKQELKKLQPPQIHNTAVS